MRESQVELQAYAMSNGALLFGAEFPSGRVVVHREDLLMLYHDRERIPLGERQLPDSRPAPRTGVGYRTEDVSGISGEGVVFDFVHFDQGWVVQEWRNEENGNLETRGIRDSGVDFRPSMSMAVKVHGHNGGTEYIYDNGEVAQT